MNKLAIFLDNNINLENIDKVREIANNYLEEGYTTAIISLDSYSTLREKYDHNEGADGSFDYLITPQDDRTFTIDQMIVEAMVEIGVKPSNTIVVLSERIGGTPLIEVRLDIHKGAF